MLKSYNDVSKSYLVFVYTVNLVLTVWTEWNLGAVLLWYWCRQGFWTWYCWCTLQGLSLCRCQHQRYQRWSYARSGKFLIILDENRFSISNSIFVLLFYFYFRVGMQWEFQVGPSVGISAGDELWVARYILEVH